MGWAPLPADAQLDQPSSSTPPATPEPAPASAAPESAPATPATAPSSFVPLPANAKLDEQNAGPATIAPVGYHTISGFEDELPAHAHEMPPEIQKQIVNILATHPLDTAASDARQYAASQGYNPAPAQNPKFGDSFDEVIDYRRQHGIVSDSVINHLPPASQSQIPLGSGPAFVRGLLPTNTIDSALHTAADAITGDTRGSIADDFRRWEDINYGVLQNDEANHPIARVTGAILGGLAIPSGSEGAALNAGKSVLQAGGTMREARAAAAAAAATRVGIEGAGVGAGYGFDASAPGQGALGAAEGAALGGAAGYGLAKGAQIIAPSIKSATAALPAADEAPDYVQLARDLGIRRTPATNSGSGIATVAQAGLGALPGGTPIAAATNREIGDLGAAAKAVAENAGQVSNPQGAGEAIAQGAQQYKAASKAQATALYQQRDSAMGGTSAPVSLDNFSKSVNDLAAQFPDSPALQQLREHPVIRQVTDALGQAADNGQVTLGQATEALSHVRGVLRNLQATNSASPVVISRVNGVEQALENDVMNGARAADQAMGRVPGTPGSAVKAQQDADAFYADRAAALNGSLKRPLQSANDDTKVSGEAVYNQVSGDMDAKSGNLARLRDTWFRLPPQARSTFAATKIDDLGRATPGQQNDAGTAWSFQRFLTNLNSLSPQARNIVFGSEADAQLQKIAAYANRLRQLDRARNFSNTAKTYFAGAFMATVGGAVMHGDLGHAMELGTALPATWGGAKLLLATPAMRDWTAKAMSALSSGNEGAMKVLTKRLGTIASTQPAIANEALGLRQAITKAANDNLRALAASGSQENPQGEGDQAKGTR